MSAAHTPGPWTYEAADDESSGMIWAKTGFIVEFNDNPSDANARLIASAPDLLEALLDCAAVMQNDLNGLAVIQPELRAALAAIAKATGSTQPAKRTPGTVPMHSHDTTVGEGDMPVTCRFDIDSDGTVENLQVWVGAGSVNIFLALTLSQIEALEAECYAAAKADYEERKYDTAIDNFIEGQQP